MIATSAMALYGPFVSAKDINEIISAGGHVHLQTSYQLAHTLVIPSGTHVECDAGVSLSDGPAHKLDFLVQFRGQDISIEGCDISATNAQVLIVLAAQSSGISITRNRLHSSDRAHAILLDAPGIRGVKINDNTIYAVGYGILQNVHAADMTDVSIDDNSFSDVWADAVELNNPVTNDCCGIRLTDVRASNVRITRNKFRVPQHAGSNPNAGFCVGVAGAHDVEITDNDCVAWNAGFHVEDRAYNIRIVGNSISTNDHDGHGENSAIWIIDGYHMTLAKNKITDAAGDGIHLDYDPGHQTTDIDIAANEIKGCGRYGLYIAGGSLGPLNSRVHDNTISGCAVPAYITGNIQSLSIHSNRMEKKNGCTVHIAKGTDKQQIDFKDNTDVNSGEDANASCPG